MEALGISDTSSSVHTLTGEQAISYCRIRDIDNAIYWYRVAAYNGSQYAKEKISYKSPNCIVETLTLVFEDDTELECRVLSAENYQGADYLIIEDPETKEYITVKYVETDTIEGFEIEQVDTKTEKIVLDRFGGVKS